MIGLLLVFTATVILTSRIHVKGLDENYLSKAYTQPIKGLFVGIVFLSHIRTYTEYVSAGDLFTIQVLNYLGQLMVALFLFYSGYGIYEAIKRKGYEYVRMIPKNRIGKTYFDFAFAILLFLIVNACLGIFYPVKRILLSLVAWSAVGNSAWYMFAVFSLYILSYLCFSVFRNNRFIAILAMSFCSLAYVYIFSIIKENYWSSTYLCFVAGMWYSYFKAYIDKILKKYPVLYYIGVVGVFVMYQYFFEIRYRRLLMFNLVSILFCLLFVFLSMKISIKSKGLTWMGDRLFWVYILQRIPMLVLDHIGFADKHPYIYLYLCFGVTIILAYYIYILTKKIKEKIWR